MHYDSTFGGLFMILSRAKFLRSSAAAILTAVISPIPVSAMPHFGFGRIIEVKDLTLETFAPHVNTLFRITRQDASACDLELVEAVDLSKPHDHNSGANSSAPCMEVFSLLFRGPAGDCISQESYEFSHPQLGRFTIFITPVVGEDTKYHHYQALFNRLVSASNDLSTKKENL
jgi:Domain of unknown function (DUF6916)